MIVKLNVGRTVNLGNYESLRVDVEAALECADSEIVKDITDMLYEELDDALTDVIRRERRINRR